MKTLLAGRHPCADDLNITGDQPEVRVMLDPPQHLIAMAAYRSLYK